MFQATFSKANGLGSDTFESLIAAWVSTLAADSFLLH